MFKGRTPVETQREKDALNLQKRKCVVFKDIKWDSKALFGNLPNGNNFYSFVSTSRFRTEI